MQPIEDFIRDTARAAASVDNTYCALQKEVQERKRIEVALRAAEAKYKGIFENAIEGIFQTTPDGHYISANPALARMYGFDSPEALITGMNDIAHQLYVDADSRERFIALIGSHGIIQGFEARIYRCDGSILWISENARAVRDGSGKLLYYEGTVEDITPRKQAEEALQHSEARFRSAFDHAPIGMALVSLDGRWLQVNETVCAILGLSETELLVLDLPTLTYPEDTELERAQWHKLLNNQARACELEKRFYRRDADLVWVLSSASLVRNDAGEPLYFVLQIQDITETKRLEQQLLQSQKMEAIGRLAGGVAHDFNNMLTVISGFTELLISGLGSGHKLNAFAQQIKKAGERAASLTQQLLAFSRKQVIAAQVLDLNAVVVDMEGMLRRLLDESIAFTFVPGENLGNIKADPGQIQQILLNLVVNARDAMPKGGRLTIETANTTLTPEYARRHVEVRPGAYVQLTISDNGCGMDAATKARLFEPFFTTKEVGKGTGLGLATLYGIVKQAEGHVCVYSEPGHGTAFKVYLPRLEEAASIAEPTGDRRTPGGTETVLVVEDEEGVRDLARSVLISAGYTVLEAANGLEALIAYEQHEGRIDLVLTDVVMPKMGGRELADCLAGRANTKTLYMSGYTDDAIVRHGVLEKGVAFLNKPFTPETLAAKVYEVLHA